MSDPYKIVLTKSALKNFERIDRAQAQKVRAKIQWLAENADELDHEALTGNLAGSFKLRFGDYRVIYVLDKEARTIEVSGVGRRRDVYDE